MLMTKFVLFLAVFVSGFQSHAETRSRGDIIRDIKQSCACNFGGAGLRGKMLEVMIQTGFQLPQSSSIVTLALLHQYLKEPIPLTEMMRPVCTEEIQVYGRALTMAHVAKGVPLALEGMPAPDHFRRLSAAQVQNAMEGFNHRLVPAVIDFIKAIAPGAPIGQFRSLPLEQISDAVLNFLNRPENQPLVQRINQRLGELLDSPELANLSQAQENWLLWTVRQNTGEQSAPPTIISRAQYVMALQNLTQKYLSREKDLSENRMNQIFLSFR